MCIRDIFLVREDSSGVRLRTFGMIFQSARKAAANWQLSSFHCSPLFHLLRSVIIYINNRNALLRFFEVCFAPLCSLPLFVPCSSSSILYQTNKDSRNIYVSRFVYILSI